MKEKFLKKPPNLQVIITEKIALRNIKNYYKNRQIVILGCFDECSTILEACREIGGCETGSAVITPGFALKARYIIHAVGPIWQGGESGEEELLYGAYERSLDLAKENGCHSIGFPVISSGIYGYPKRPAWEVAVRACGDFINENQDYQIYITFAVLSDASRKMGEEVLASFD